jgi:NAD(P)-dependent dehydrogenase (short-subunit alcohol dehydrogenase family)
MPRIFPEPGKQAPRSVIFGGTSGIGLATAGLLRERGHDVVVVSRSAEALRAAGSSLGGEASWASVDASDDKAVQQFFAANEPFDNVIVSLAGGAAIGPFQAISDAALRQALEVKVFAYANIARHARTGVAPEGTITLVTGVSGARAVANAASLGMANAAIEALVRTLALEYAPLRVNAVAPGTTATSAWDRIPQAMRDEMFHSSAQRTPLKRVAQPEDVALAIVSLIENTFVTGVVSVCDGGASLV